MAKTGLTAEKLHSLLRERSAGPGWSLCVGAGISKPAFPDWRELVEQLVTRDVGPDHALELTEIQRTYSADAFIQAAMDRLRLTEADFAGFLSVELYASAKKCLSRSEWRCFVDALSSRHLSRLKLDRWAEFLRLIDVHFPRMTARHLATTLAEVLGEASAPNSIISFNAEPLLPALINGAVAVRRGNPNTKDVIDYVTHATSDRKANRTPFFFCHGLLPVPDSRTKGIGDSVDKLVFSESSYLQLANSSFSWQSASFIRAAAHQSLVFIGLSLADPNMRRWLSWVHSVRVAELTQVGAPSPTSTVHYWITRTHESQHACRWTESLVAHLGIRIVWVDSFEAVAPTFRTMLGLQPVDVSPKASAARTRAE